MSDEMASVKTMQRDIVAEHEARYARLKAERDEWKRRHAEVNATLDRACKLAADLRIERDETRREVERLSIPVTDEQIGNAMREAGYDTAGTKAEIFWEAVKASRAQKGSPK